MMGSHIESIYFAQEIRDRDIENKELDMVCYALSYKEVLIDEEYFRQTTIQMSSATKGERVNY